MWTGPRPAPPSESPHAVPSLPGSARLASWRLLIDRGRLQEGEPYLAQTARATEALVSADTAVALGLMGASTVSLATDRGAVTLPLRIADIADGAVWAPLRSEGCDLLELGAHHGTSVRVTGGPA
jgi:NADH-quinone oxidoreductase subunit G